jgi:hypothetical protein
MCVDGWGQAGAYKTLESFLLLPSLQLEGYSPVPGRVPPSHSVSIKALFPGAGRQSLSDPGATGCA